MPVDPSVREKAARLDDLALRYETAVLVLPAADYAEAFRAFYGLKSPAPRLLDAPGGFHAALREVSGDDVWQPIVSETERLFGPPRRVTVFADGGALLRELEGPDGLGPFFFLFDLLFCEYGDFTLCFISGSNN